MPLDISRCGTILVTGDDMRINTRFPVAVHILAFATLYGEASKSELLAKSVGTNPVVVRRISGMLKKAGLITVHAGVGGITLNRPPEEIALLDIYCAVKEREGAALFDLHQDPNPLCPVGANIHHALAQPLLQAQQCLEESLAQRTLAEVVAGIRQEIQKGS